MSKKLLPMLTIRKLRKLVGRPTADLIKRQPVRLDIYYTGCPDSAYVSRSVWVAYRHAGELGLQAGAYELLPAEAFENRRTLNGYDRSRPAVSVTISDFNRAEVNPLYLGV